MRAIFIFFFSCALLYSCKHENIKPEDNSIIIDTQKPEISITRPIENSVFTFGDTIKIDAVITDNQALSKCVVSLGFIAGNDEVSIWEPESDTILLSGKYKNINTNLFKTGIPQCKEGTYNLTIEVSDSATAPNITVKDIKIVITSGIPLLTIFEPVDTSVFTFGDIIKLNAHVADNKSLKNCIASLNIDLPYDTNEPWNPDHTIIPLSGTSQNINDTLFNGVIPQCAEGIYNLKVELRDNEPIANITTKNIKIEITSGIPLLAVTKPQEDANFTTNADTLMLSAVCSDKEGLTMLIYSVKMNLKSIPGVDAYSGATMFPPWEPGTDTIFLSGKNAEFVDFPLYEGKIPLCQQGYYKLVLQLFNTKNNSTQKEINFFIN
jgi:hypothetical protein